MTRQASAHGSTSLAQRDFKTPPHREGERSSRPRRGRPHGRQNRPKPHQPSNPLVVSPRVAGELLGVSRWKIYDMLGRGELDRVKFGWAARITMDSIRRYLKQSVA